MLRIVSFGAALAASLVVLLATPAAAQDGTPAAQPIIGSELSYVDAEGIERGLVAVDDLLDPFEPADDASPPDEGYRYVLATVAFEATAEQPFEADPFDLLLQDADGFLYRPTSVPLPADAVVPELQSQTLAPGNRISGVVGFEIPEPAEASSVFYQPASDRLLLLAAVGSTGGPAIGTELAYADPEGGEARIAVTAASDPFDDYDPNRPPTDDLRYVLVTIAFENVGERPFDATPSNVLLRDADGFLYAPTSAPLPADAVVPELQSQTLAPGNRISGVVAFAAPAEAEISGVHYQPQSDRLLLLTDLGSSPDQDATPTARGAVGAPNAPPADRPAAATGRRGGALGAIAVGGGADPVAAGPAGAAR